MSEYDHEHSRKILLMGLDNSGKTSILFNLRKVSNILSFYSLNPTPGLTIASHIDKDIKFYLWDFGGQQKYRERYLLHLDEYTFKVDEIIFVIDVQDPERYDIALKYLQEIIEHLEKTQEDEVELSVYLHKFEPIENKEEFSEKNIKEKILDRIQKFLTPKIKYKVYKTRIYTVFEKEPIKI